MEKKNPEERHGKQNNQKMKPYLVMQHLLKYTDENNLVIIMHSKLSSVYSFGLTFRQGSKMVNLL